MSWCDFCKADPCINPDFCSIFKEAQRQGKLQTAVAALTTAVHKIRQEESQRGGEQEMKNVGKTTHHTAQEAKKHVAPPSKSSSASGAPARSGSAMGTRGAGVKNCGK